MYVYGATIGFVEHHYYLNVAVLSPSSSACRFSQNLVFFLSFHTIFTYNLCSFLLNIFLVWFFWEKKMHLNDLAINLYIIRANTYTQTRARLHTVTFDNLADFATMQLFTPPLFIAKVPFNLICCMCESKRRITV